MDFRVVGAHQDESIDGRSIAFLIDGTIALDAGGLAGGLTANELAGIGHVLLTHHHFDHVKDLMWLGLTRINSGSDDPVDIYCSQTALGVMREHLFVLWGLDFFKALPGRHASFVHRPLHAGRPFQVGPYDVLPLENRHHPVPVLAYQLTTPEGKRLLFTSDTGPGIRDIWPLAEPDLLVTEVTYPDRLNALAPRVGHLTPSLLEDELRAFEETKGYLPRVLVCHINQTEEATVVEELAEVARRLHATIDIAHEDMRIEL